MGMRRAPQGTMERRPADELHSLRALWRAGYTPARALGAVGEGVRGFYVRQNELLALFREGAAVRGGGVRAEDEAFLEELCEEEEAGEAGEAGEEDGLVGRGVGYGAISWDAAYARDPEAHDRRAVRWSTIGNVCLLVSQIYACFVSRSLSMLGLALESLLDVICTLVVAGTWAMKRGPLDRQRYPVGRARLEPLGVIAMASIMTTATFGAIRSAVSALAAGHEEAVVELTLPVAVVIAAAVVTKGALYLYCRSSTDASVEALRVDHLNDVVSSSVAVVAILLSKYVWWLDPLGGLFISAVIIYNWYAIVLEHVETLVSKSADHHLINQVIFMALNHSHLVHSVDTVRAYHVGVGVFVECDIVLHKDLPLSLAHDTGESLQVRIEQLDAVERCFVHLDFESDHHPASEHRDVH